MVRNGQGNKSLGKRPGAGSPENDRAPEQGCNPVPGPLLNKGGRWCDEPSPTSVAQASRLWAGHRRDACATSPALAALPVARSPTVIWSLRKTWPAGSFPPCSRQGGDALALVHCAQCQGDPGLLALADNGGLDLVARLVAEQGPFQVEAVPDRPGAHPHDDVALAQASP